MTVKDAGCDLVEPLVERESDLTTGSLARHLRRMAVPASIGFFFHVLFNVTDTLVAGFISTDAQAALAFSFPLFFIQVALSIGLTQATTSMIARSYGGGKTSQARYYLGQITLSTAIIGVLVAVVGILLSRPMLLQLGITSAQLAYALDYLIIIFLGAPLLHFSHVMSGVLSAHGNTHTYRNALIAASLFNVVVDPALAFGWLGLPALGMKGIALATLLAQLMMVVWMGLVIKRMPIMEGMRLIHLSPRWGAQLRILGQSLPPSLNMLSINFGFVICTYYLARIDTLAVAAYGIALRIEQLILLLTIGLNIALLAVASQNYGAGKFERLYQVRKLAVRYGLVIVACGALVMVVLGHQLMWLFNREDVIISYGYEYLVAASIIGPIYIVAHADTASLQAIARPMMIGLFGVFRLVVLPSILCWVFVIHYDFGSKGVWASLVISNVLATLIIHWYVRRVLARMAPLPSVKLAGVAGEAGA